LGSGALWIAANRVVSPPNFSEDSMRLGQLIQPKKGLKPSGKLPESGR
jgi:hypothetical protein